MSTPRSPSAWLAAAALAVALAPTVQAADGADTAAQRQRIAQERATVQARARAAEQECRQRFVVTPCVDRVRGERRAALQRLDQQAAVLDDAQRKQRAAQRAQRIQQRHDDQARADEQRMAPDGQSKVRAVRTPAAQGEGAAGADATAAPKAVRQTAAGAQQRAAASAREREDAAQRSAAARRRADQAEAHRTAVEKRNADRARRHPPQATLPLPASAPAP